MNSLLNPAATGNPPKVAPGTNIASTVASDGSTVFVYYQNTTGGILEIQFDGRTWTGGASSPALFHAAPYTPLAAINWDNGDQRRIYYLDEHYTIQEFCYISGTWGPGRNFKLGFPRAAPRTSLSALLLQPVGAPQEFRVYYQTADSLNIQELSYSASHDWTASATLPPALDGTSIAAEEYNYGTTTVIRLYCQTSDLRLRENLWNNDEKKWVDQVFGPGTVPACTPIATVGWYITNNNTTQLVHWINTNRNFTQGKFTTRSTPGWVFSDVVVGGPLPSYTKIATCQSNNGETARLYYQLGDCSILETRNDAEAGWSKGSYVQAG